MKYGKFVNKVALSGLVAACMFGAATTAAQAGTFTYKFYQGGAGYTGAYSGNVMYTGTSGLATNCPNGLVTCTSDVLGDPLNFAANTLQATSPGAMVALADTNPGFGGLGVVNSNGSGDDNIGTTDVLKISFGTAVTLTGVGTLFTSAHNPFGALDAAGVLAASSALTFLLSTDNVTFSVVSFLNANSAALLGFTSSAFYFKQNTATYACGTANNPNLTCSNPSFYVSALRVVSSRDQLPPVPIPAALPLFLGALGGLGALARFRSRRQKATAIPA